MKFVRLNECPVCKRTPTETTARVIGRPQVIDGFPMATLLGYDTCLMCGVVFQNPRMSDEDIPLYYISGEYRKSTITETQSQEVLDLKESKDADRYAAHPFIKQFSGGTVVDMGCSRGYFLSLLKDSLSFRTIGVELNHEYVEIKPLELHSSMSSVKDAVSLVTAFHVLEHVPAPKDFLSEMVSKIVPGGGLMVEVPSAASPGGQYRLSHLYYLQPWVITRWLEEMGMTDVTVELTPHFLFTAKKPDMKRGWSLNTIDLSSKVVV